MHQRHTSKPRKRAPASEASTNLSPTEELAGLSMLQNGIQSGGGAFALGSRFLSSAPFPSRSFQLDANASSALQTTTISTGFAGSGCLRGDSVAHGPRTVANSNPVKARIKLGPKLAGRFPYLAGVPDAEPVGVQAPGSSDDVIPVLSSTSSKRKLRHEMLTLDLEKNRYNVHPSRARQ